MRRHSFSNGCSLSGGGDSSLVLLGIDDPLGQGAQRAAGAVRGRPAGNHDGLCVMADHGGHEVNVCRGVGMAGAVGLCSGDGGELASVLGGWLR